MKRSNLKNVVRQASQQKQQQQQQQQQHEAKRRPRSEARGGGASAAAAASATATAAPGSKAQRQMLLKQQQEQQKLLQQQQQQLEQGGSFDDDDDDVSTDGATTAGASSSSPLFGGDSLIKAMFHGTSMQQRVLSPQDFFDKLCDKTFVHVKRSALTNRLRDFFRTQLPVEWSTEHMREAIRTKRLRHKTDINIVRYDGAEKRRVDYLETEEMQQRMAAMESGEHDDDGGGEHEDDDGGFPVVTVEDFDKATASGWSVRFLRPQEHVPSLSQFIFRLEEELQCSCGVNSYWTPRGSQGFSPHWDDVDVFLLQLEGQKHWRLYKAPSKDDVHPRVSSEDFKPEELGPAPPILDCVLRTGEMIYMPRGTIHQGDTSHIDPRKDLEQEDRDSGETHSLHVTFSAFQMHTWADVVEATYKYRCEFSAANVTALRETLPLNWMRVMGSVCNAKMMGPHVAPLSEADERARAAIQLRMRGFFEEIHKALMTKDGVLDKGVDAHARSVLERRQPPPTWTAAIGGGDDEEDAEENEQDEEGGAPAALFARTEFVDLSPAATKIRLLYRSSVRFVMMTDEVRLYHCGGNSVVCLAPREHRLPLQRLVVHHDDDDEDDDKDDEDENVNLDDEEEAPPSSATGMLRFDMSFGPALATIVTRSPGWVRLSQLPGVSMSDDAAAGSGAAAGGGEEEPAPIGVTELRSMINALLATGCFEVSNE